MGQVIDGEELKQRVREAQTAGQRVVFTNGVFDLLHIGHVRYLQAARDQGDLLVIGLNSDRSTRQLKGPGRPIVPQDERAQVLCALACVDYVIVFDDPTAEQLVAALQPDVYVKGGDYQLEPQGPGASVTATAPAGKALPEAVIVERHGGRVVLLPYLVGHSTTELIRKICATSDSTR